MMRSTPGPGVSLRTPWCCLLVPGTGLAAVLRTLPMFHDEEHARARGLPEDTLVLPPARPGQRVVYTVLECQPLFDSSDMTIAEWVQIAQTIERHYAQYDGFVVIHGTDTMAFAASVLSFVLENLQKTIIFTGAQVCLFFQNQLFRGNRVTKVDTRRFAAFCSPNLPPLAIVGADVTINRELVRRAGGKGRLMVHSSVERDVGLLRLYPGIPAPLVRAFLQPPLKGVVLETFGSGNGPTKPDLLQELRAAAERGLVIVNCTHCLQGAAMAGAGTVSGFDMTSEAALAKLSYVLGLPGLGLSRRKELLVRDLRGEMTPPAVDELWSSVQGNALSHGVAQLLSLSQEADAVRDALAPSLACAAAHAGDLEALQVLAELAPMSIKGFSGQAWLQTEGEGAGETCTQAAAIWLEHAGRVSLGVGGCLVPLGGDFIVQRVISALPALQQLSERGSPAGAQRDRNEGSYGRDDQVLTLDLASSLSLAFGTVVSQ
ncbi:lysophospholipase [Camelus ferus]|nr:lysophospholipase [Camelus ferus]